MCNLTSMYMQKKFHMLVIALVLVGGVNWLAVGVLGKDLVRLVASPKVARVIYVIVGLSALGLLFQRDIYLPFLGETLVPAGALAPKSPQGANDQVTITTKPGAKVVFWASEPNPTGKALPTWKEAYGDYENSGVAVADDRGKALLRFRGPPQAYSVPVHGRLEPHVHFRVAAPDGIMGRVQTYFLKDGRVEGFADMF